MGWPLPADAFDAIALERSLRSTRKFPVRVQSQPKSGIRVTSFLPMATAPGG